MPEPSGGTKIVTPDPVLVMSTTWCGHCRRLKRQLEEAAIPYTEVDVDEHHEYDALIIAHTGGFRTVPAVRIGDRLLVNPSIAELETAMEQAGYQ